MFGVTAKARDVVFKNRTFRLNGGRPFRLDFHDGLDAGPERDGRLSIDGGRVLSFEFLGRARARNGAMLGFLRIGGERGRLMAFDAALRNFDVAEGKTHIGYADLDAALPLTLPCFVSGTRLRTPGGMVPVEALSEGDRVSTRDGAEVVVQQAIHRNIDPAEEAFDADARPVVVLADSFAPGVPARDIKMSRRQRAMMCGWRADQTFDYSGVLAPIGCLVDGEGIVPDCGSEGGKFVHLVMDRPGVIMAEGLPVDAVNLFQSEPRGYRSITEREVEAIGPSIHAAPLSEIGRPARPPLGRWEMSALERDSVLGTWSNALRLITVPASTIGQDAPCPLSGHGAAPLMRVGETGGGERRYGVPQRSAPAYGMRGR